MRDKPAGGAAQFTQLEQKLGAAQRELQSMLDRVQEIEDEKRRLELDIARVKGKIEVLELLFSEERVRSERRWVDLANLGIQECCYRVLLESSEPLDATLISLRLKDHNVDIDRYANPLAVIHTSLKRMPDRVRSFKREDQALTDGRTVWVRFYEAIKPDEDS